MKRKPLIYNRFIDGSRAVFLLSASDFCIIIYRRRLVRVRLPSSHPVTFSLKIFGVNSYEKNSRYNSRGSIPVLHAARGTDS
jgi:hypothetical protein